MNYESGYEELLDQVSNLEERQLNQAQMILELQEENENYKKREQSSNRSAQEKEGYITDMMTCHQQRMKAIELLCLPHLNVRSQSGSLADRVQAIIDNIEPSIATARDQRLDVFSQPLENDTDKSLAKEDQAVLDRMTASAKHARDVRLRGPEEN